MSVTNQDIALSIIHFLKLSVEKKEISEEYAESMDVAIDCIADAFEVDKDSDKEVVANKFSGKSLSELLSQHRLSRASEQEEVKEKGDVDESTKAQADELKTEGNRAMAAKNFDEAISKYSQAVELNPYNAVYLSNRAAAYSSLGQHENAIKDAEKAIDIDPGFSKAYSRLGLAQYAKGNASESMKAYQRGLEAEGDKKSDAMLKGFETAKRRVEEDLEKLISNSTATRDQPASDDASSAGTGTGAGAGAGGFPDLSSILGGGGGGMPSLSDMMNNPQVMQAAQSLMSNPSALQGLMNNPSVRQMAENFTGGNGETPNMADIMNNPMLKNLANQFMGGNSNSNNDNNNNTQNE